MKGALGLKKGSVPFKNDLETTLHNAHTYVRTYVPTYVCTYVRSWEGITVWSGPLSHLCRSLDYRR